MAAIVGLISQKDGVGKSTLSRALAREPVFSVEAFKTAGQALRAGKDYEFMVLDGAARASVAAHVRTKATHAQWDEFDLPVCSILSRQRAVSCKTT